MRSQSLLCLLLAAALALGGCSGTAPTPAAPPAPGGPPLTVVWGEGGARTVQSAAGEARLQGRPSRVAALGVVPLDFLLSLGVRPAVAALPKGDPPVVYLQREVKALPARAGAEEHPDLEQVAAVRPDLIVADADLHAALYPALARLAPVVAVRGGLAPDGLLAEAEALAAALGDAGAANGLRQRYGDLRQAALGAAKGGATVVALHGPPEAARAWTDASTIGALLRLLGATNLVGQRGGGAPAVALSTDELLQLNPDVFFYFTDLDEVLSRSWNRHPAFRRLQAVNNQRVFEMDVETWARPAGPQGMLKALQQVTAYLYAQPKNG